MERNVRVFLVLVVGAIPWAVLPRANHAAASALAPAASREAENIDAMVHRLWADYKKPCHDNFAQRMKIGDVYGLYDVQLALAPLQQYAINTRDLALIDDLAAIYLEAFSALSKGKDGFQKWIFSSKDTYVAKENPQLVGGEVKLCSSQFLHGVSSLLAAIARTPVDQRTPAMKQLAEQFPAVIVRDHYLRWTPSDAGRFKKLLIPVPRSDILDRTGARAVSDTEMWVLTGVANMLAANHADEKAVALTAEEKKAFRDFVELGTKLLEGRMSKSKLKDLQGRDVEGLNFDLGMWDAYPDYAYAGYTGETYPTETDKKSAANVGWDISHARRFVDVFTTLHEARPATGQEFPDEQVMKGLANQVAYGTFNRDLKHPLFTNFMDGSNGWYRVGYAGRKNFGYAPFMLTSSIPDGGYGFWSKFQPDIRVELAAFWQWAKDAEKDNDATFVKYYGKGYFPGTADNAPKLLMFLPTIAR